jgi:hypothetical protein
LTYHHSAEIPPGVEAGTCFTFVANDGRTISVQVPLGKASGQFLDVVLPTEEQSDGEKSIKVSKGAIGAALVGR